MTKEQTALARRAVACRGWRWIPGARWIVTRAAPLEDYAGEMGVLGPYTARIFMKTPTEHVAGVHIGLTLRDNIIDDMKGAPVREPRQDLKVGDRVRFEIEGVIKERQTSGFKDLDGNDLKPVQYVIQVGGARFWDIGIDQIVKVIGKETE